MCLGILPSCYVVCAWCPLKPEEGIKFLGMGITVVNHCVCVVGTLVLWESSQCSELLSHFSNHLLYFKETSL